MKKLIVSIAIILLLFILTSCDNTNIVSEDAPNQSISETEAIAAETGADLYEKVLNSYETWLVKGLKAYETGKAPVDMTDFFLSEENISYLTLYDHMFEYDNKTSTDIAEALFKFICDTYGTEALFDLDKRVEYKNAYLESLGLPPTYIQDEDIEKFFISMYCSKSGQEYPYHIAFDNIHYYFKDFKTGYDYDYKPFHFHEYIYKNTQGMIKMTEKIKEFGLDKYLNTEQDFHFHMTLGDGLISYTTYKDRKMYISNMQVSLHEAIHAMGIGNCRNIWLSEGICDYFNTAFEFNTMFDRAHIQSYQDILDGEYDDAIEAGNKIALYQKRYAQAYADAGGSLGDSTVLDYRLLVDSGSRVDLKYGNENTIGAALIEINGNPDGLIGVDLTYTQASSMVFYLVDTYGIETVISACVSDDILGHFGKTYEELKTEWIAYLN